MKRNENLGWEVEKTITSFENFGETKRGADREAMLAMIIPISVELSLETALFPFYYLFLG